MTYPLIVKILVFCELLTSIHCDVITLQYGNKIVCLANITIPVFILPPVQQSENLKSVVSNGIWTQDDWTFENATVSGQGPVTDKRWEDFATVFTNQQNRSLESVTSLSFSVYNPEKLYFHIHKNGEKYIKIWTKEVVPSKQETWTHYQILIKNETTFIFENNHLISTFEKIDNVNDKEIIILSNKNIYWKMHEYSFRVARVKTSNIWSSVTIPPTRKSCLFLYTSLCQKCFLVVQISDGKNQTNITINSTPQMLWQQYKIDVDPNKETKLTFYRGKSEENSDHDFWAHDLRLCPDTEQNMGIYRHNTSELNSTEHKCHMLADDNTVDGDTSHNQIFCSKPGKLGGNCDISCENILKSNFKNCEQHRICTNSVCVCAWGYNGTFCAKSCQSGTWGSSCRYVCAAECATCDTRTGECMGDNKTGCQSGTWGSSCENVCSAGCPACDKRTGECMGDNKTDVVSVVIVIGFVLLILAAIVMAALCRVLRLRKTRRRESVQDIMKSQESLI